LQCGGTMPRNNIKHNLRKHPLYNKWAQIKQRCYNKNNKRYCYYGGKGIKMFSEWVKCPEKFINWVETNLGLMPDGCSLDRIDNNGDYSPGNLRWATQSIQNRNRGMFSTNKERNLPLGVAITPYNKFTARVHKKYIGTFDTPEEAHIAYLEFKNER
jgi:hypothetical protein